MNRLAVRRLVASLSYVAALMTGCDPGAGGGVASAAPAAPASAATPRSAASASTAPTDYSY